MRRDLLVFSLLVLFTVPVRSADTFRIVAFGDSITEGTPFDAAQNARCDSSRPGWNAQFCGYPVRLARPQFFNCNGSNCMIQNEGKAFESTPVGVSRADSVLRKRAWDLLILMEGTNDIARISTQTTDFNLNRIAEKAKARGIATVQSSIIWIHPSFPRPETGVLNSRVQDLRGKIRSRAAGRKRCFADPWTRLCPGGSGSCFAQHYWTPTGRDPVGHPDPSGYDLMAQEFWKATGAKREPGAASPTAPSGKLCASRPVFEWNKETVAKANCGNWFRVEVSGPRGKALDSWFQEADVCSGNKCRLTSPVTLKQGNHALRVRTRNTAGYGPWSADESFEVLPPAPAPVSELFGPAEDLFAAGGLDPEFEWKKAGDAPNYRLEVTSEDGDIVVDEGFVGSDICPGARCQVNAGRTLDGGSYSWRVRSENECGGTFSQDGTFTIFDSPPPAPLALTPAEPTLDPTPIFKWQTVPGADSYELEDALGNTVQISPDQACKGGVCSWESVLLSPGPYSWRVRASNPIGQGSFSDPVGFDLRPCNCSEGTFAGGSRYLIAMPENWNGDLVIWNQASNFFGVRQVEDLGPLAISQFDEGFAVAASSYTVAGWPLFQSNSDLKKLTTLFVTRHGNPGKTYLVGESTGGLVAAAALEKGKFGKVDGAFAMCSPLAGSRNWEAAFDMWLAFRSICGNVGGAELPGNLKGLPRNHGLEASDIEFAVNRCTGLNKDKPKRTNLEKTRLRDLLAVTGIPEAGLYDAMNLATFGFGDLVRDKKKLKNRLPVGNESVDYGSPSLNASIQRGKAEARGRKKLRQFYDPNGRVGSAKVISIHTTKDPVFYVENQSEYSALVDSDNLTLGIVEEKSASHCGFTAAERLAGWKWLVDWVENDRKPRPRDLQNRCTQLQGQVGGPCRFNPRLKPKPLNTRVRDR